MTDKSPVTDPFIIVDLSGSKEAAGIRKKIRSRAARHSHEVGRKARKPSENNRREDLLLLPPRAPLRPEPSLLTSSSSSSSESITPSSHQPAFLPLTDTIPKSSSADVNEHERLHQQDRAIDDKATNSSTRTQSPIRRDLPLFVLREEVHNGLVYPVPEQWFFARTIQFMWQWMPHAWQMLQVTDKDREDALVWVKQLTMSNPSYFYMNMLSAATTLVAQRVLPADIIPWLMTQTVRAINDALSRPETMLEVGVILAVGRIALRECMRGVYGTGVAVHRPAQARMLAMAGGLDTLPVPLLVKEHILWGERLLVERTGVSLIDLNPGAMRKPDVTVATEFDNRLLKSYYMEDRQVVEVTD